MTLRLCEATMEDNGTITLHGALIRRTHRHGATVGMGAKCDTLGYSCSDDQESISGTMVSVQEREVPIPDM